MVYATILIALGVLSANGFSVPWWCFTVATIALILDGIGKLAERAAQE